jgi:tetratricopeptide (TPR) repeat protein
LKVFLYIIISILLIGCNGSKNIGAISDKTESTITIDEPTFLKMKGMFIDAQTQKNIGNFDQAMSLLDRVLEIDPNHHASLFDQAMMLERKGEYDSAIKKVEKATLLDPSNTWYKVLKGQLYARTNRFGIAEKVYMDLIKSDEDNFEFNYDLASIRMQLGNFEDAIDALNEIEKKTGFNEDIIFEKQSLYLDLKKPELARKEVQKLIDNDPQESRYYNMMASIYEFENNDEKVMENLAKVEELDPNNGLVKLYLYDFYYKKGDKEKANETLREAFDNVQIDIDTKMEILLRYYELVAQDPTELDNAYQLINLLKKTHPEEAKSHAISGDFLLQDGKVKEARDAFKKASELDPSKIAVWSQLIALDAQLNDMNLLISDSELALEYFPMAPMFYYYNGIANGQNEEYNKALESLLSGKEMIVNDVQLEAEFYSALGDNYHELNKHKESDNYFDKSLKINPNNAFVLNNYSYYLAIRKQKLELAENMARLANELEPNSTSFQDTFGWVLYASGKYSESKIWLQKAIDNGGNESGEVLEHFGDVLFQLGEKDLALENWKKAKDKGDFSDNLLEKISTKNLID